MVCLRFWKLLGVLDRRVYVRNNSHIPQPAHSCQRVITRVRVLAVVEVRRYGDEVRLRQPVAHSPDEIIHAAGVLNYDNGGDGFGSVRNAYVAAHCPAIDAYRVPSRWHSDLLP